ncbi:MAG TPA: winged helix-turn-helix domain-containing protein [Thermoanaerobaculia bacterium]|jgi:DNA-binding winged helix-turn-helix (wHTH) protein/Tfp pilus assembly protein PilF|nr:winged helix-turn-helix domain-containing protein [Thermoanaerobaculia bacterium]
MVFSALGCQVDPLLRLVTDATGRTTRLEPKACDLLVVLAGKPHEVFSVEQLIESVWAGKFVTSDVVMVAIYALRQAFGDSARQPRFIETVRGRGYRWIAPLDGEAATTPPPAMRRSPPVALALLAVILLLISAGCAWLLLRRPAPLPSMTRTAALLRAQARGLFFGDRRTAADMEKAVEEFRRAIAIDARFAEPHAALAESLVRQMEMNAEVSAAREAEARREASRAMALDPQSSLAHAARASVQFVLDRDMVGAEASFRRALELDSSIPSVHRRYGYLLAANGRFPEALGHARTASELAPTSSSTFADLGWIELVAGDVAAAERDLREAVRLDPTNGGAAMTLASCLDATGREKEAWGEYRRALSLVGVPPAVLATADAAFAAGGLRGVYASMAGRRRLPRFVAALYAARAGRRADALALLGESVARREPMTLWIAVDPDFASLHHDAAFMALARRAGVGDAAR